MADALQESLIQPTTSQNEKHPKQINVSGAEIENKNITMIGIPNVSFIDVTFSNCSIKFIRN